MDCGVLPADIADQVRFNHDLMQLWDQILPGKVLHVPYERLVRDAKGTSRQLLEHCGLAWDDAVLDFHKSSRTVQTASLHQVGAGLFSWAAITSTRCSLLVACRSASSCTQAL